MNRSDFTTTILVGQTPAEAFSAINNPRGWWSEEIEGSTDKLDDEFTYHYKDVHNCKIKLNYHRLEDRWVWFHLKVTKVLTLN